MYRVITYRSKLLKKTTYSYDEISAADDSVADFDDFEYEEIEKKSKKKKKQKEEQIYEIDGEAVREEDLSVDEKLDMEANALLNVDGFYNALLPLDYYDTEENNYTDYDSKKKVNTLGIVLVLVGTVIALGAIAFIYFTVLR